MIHILCIALAAAGFAMLATAMDRHQKDIIGRRLTPAASRRMRRGGTALLVATLIVGMIAMGAAVGTIAWFGHLMVGAAIILTALCWHSARVKSPNKAEVTK